MGNKVDLRQAVRTASFQEIKEATEKLEMRHELMARNAEGGASLLMLAAAVHRVDMLQGLAKLIKHTVSNAQHAHRSRRLTIAPVPSGQANEHSNLSSSSHAILVPGFESFQRTDIHSLG